MARKTPQETVPANERQEKDYNAELSRIRQEIGTEVSRSIRKDISYRTAGREPLTDFIGAQMSQRLAAEASRFEEGGLEGLEEIGSADKVMPHMLFEDRGLSVYLQKDRHPEMTQALIRETIRANLLARAAFIDFRGNSSSTFSASKSSYPETPHLEDWIVALGRLLEDPKALSSEEPKDSGDVEIFKLNLPKLGTKAAKERKDLMAKAHELDPELFPSLMIAFGIRNQVGVNGKTFNQAWGSLDQGYSNFGAKILLGGDHIPHRSRHKKEDIETVLRLVREFEGEGMARVETFDDLETRLKKMEAERKKEKAETENQLAELRRQLTESESGRADALTEVRRLTTENKSNKNEAKRQARLVEQLAQKLERLLAGIKSVAAKMGMFAKGPKTELERLAQETRDTDQAA